MKLVKSKLLSTCFLLLLAFSAPCADSLKVLTRDALTGIIREFHPVAKAAQLAVRRSEAGITESRGAFDPYFNASVERKELAGKTYYNYASSQLVIPTWYGVDIKTGVEEVTGDRVNPETSLGQYGYVGLKFTPTSVLFDKRRAVLQQAKAVAGMTASEQRLAVNDLLYDAMAVYWNWMKEYRVYNILTDAARLNEERMRFIKQEYEQGVRAAIDTTEALAQYLGICQQQNAAQVASRNAALELSAYLWTSEGQPWLLDDSTVPDTAVADIAAPPSLLELTQLAVQAHPKLAIMEQKNRVLELERKLKAQYLLPKLTFNAAYINKGFKLPDDVNGDVLNNNYKFTADLSMPLFLREARGAFSASKFKIQELDLQRGLVSLQIENKVKAYYNEFAGLGSQLSLMRQVYSSNRTLYQGELLRYRNGESTLFLLNARENKLLESGQKLTEIHAKYHKAFAGLLWAAGTLQ